MRHSPVSRPRMRGVVVYSNVICLNYGCSTDVSRPPLELCVGYLSAGEVELEAADLLIVPDT